MTELSARPPEQMPSNLLADADPAVVRDYYQSVIDSVDSVIYTVDRELRIVGVNRQWDAFALANGAENLTSQHILGTRLLSQMKGAPLERWQTVCQQILDGQLPRYLDEVACEEQFAWQHYTLVANPLRDRQGEVLGLTFVATNITQLKRAELEMLRRLIEVRGLRQVAHVAGARFDQRAFYKQITADIAHLFDANKCVIFRWAKRSGHLQAQVPAFGLTARELIDLSLDIGDPADPASLWQDLEERDYILLSKGDDALGSLVEASTHVGRSAAMMAVLRVSGRVHGTILVGGRDRPFSERDGQLLATFAVPIVLSIEASELNQWMLNRTRQLAATREELERVTKAAQSLRAPLTVVRGYLELLLDDALGPVPDRQAATMNMLLDKTRNIARVVHQLWPSQSVSDAARYELVYLVDPVQRAVDRQSASIERAGLDLVTQLPARNDEECVTAGDPGLLFDVFDALLDNAVKFSPNGGVIQVSMHESSEIVYVRIDDPGIGIPAHNLSQLWQPKKHRGDSTSISLGRVKQIVEEHGGQVWADSQPGRGSTFYVALPRIMHK
jgi:signal transduction histidine kinase